MLLYTVGHGTAGQDELTALCTGAGIDLVVDIRTAPGSRRHPHVARDAMAVWTAAAGVGYRWERRLGGWRRPEPDSPNIALRNDSFRGYADYMRTPAFWEALDEVLAEAQEQPTAVMCSEAVYWRCHRRLVADAAVLGRGVEVLHLFPDGSLRPHRLTDGVRVDEGLLVYDVGAQSPLSAHPGVDDRQR